MAELPNQRRRRNKPPESTPSESSASASAPVERPSAPSQPGLARRIFANSNVAWALVTGLAVGFAVGREAHRFGLSDGQTADNPSATSTAFIAAEKASPKAYARAADFPADWVKDADLPSGATLFAGLTDAQKTTVMQAMNERNCECGCAYGTLAHCLQKDPNCPRSPAMAKLAVDLVKQGKSLGEILTAIDDKQKDMGGGQKPQAAPAAPTGPQRVELAAWNPRKGPKAAKVTVVEFSDFQ